MPTPHRMSCLTPHTVLGAIAPTLLLGAMCAADLTYFDDQRFLLAQTSFGVSQTKFPPVALASFNDTVQAQSTLPGGSCLGQASQTSAMTAAGITASGACNPSALANESTGLLFAASGRSVFAVSFTTDADAILDLSGQFTTGLVGNASADFLIRLRAGDNTLIASTTGGPFQFSALIFSGPVYTIEISATANAFSFFLAAPQSSSANATFALSATTRAPTCPGDLNADGFVDDADFTMFAAAYNVLDCADPQMPPGCPADLNSDDVVDDSDFSVFAPAYDALLCE